MECWWMLDASPSSTYLLCLLTAGNSDIQQAKNPCPPTPLAGLLCATWVHIQGLLADHWCSALPKNKDRLNDWTCFAWMLVLSSLKVWLVSNELEVTSLNRNILAQAEILERICRVVVAWLVCVYSVHSVLGLETWHAMQNQHPTSKTITGHHSAKVRWGWKSPWNMRTESDVGNSYFEVTMDEWIQKQKSRYGLPWQEAPTEDVLRCFGVLPFFLLNRARLLTVEIPREHPKLLFHVWRCSHVVGYCSNKDLHMTLRLTLPQKYVNGANKEALKSRMGKEGSRSVFGEKTIHRLLTYPVLKSRRLTNPAICFVEMCSEEIVIVLALGIFIHSAKHFSKILDHDDSHSRCANLSPNNLANIGVQGGQAFCWPLQQDASPAVGNGTVTISIDLFYYQTSWPNRGNMRKIRSPQTSCTWKLLWPYVFQCTMECAAKVPTQLAANPLYLRLVAFT